MEDLLISTLGQLGLPVRKQGSLLANEPYPTHFFTFWNDSADGVVTTQIMRVRSFGNTALTFTVVIQIWSLQNY